MKNYTRFALGLTLLAVPMIGCGTAKAEPCGIRCLSTTPAPTPAPVPTTPTK